MERQTVACPSQNVFQLLLSHVFKDSIETFKDSIETFLSFSFLMVCLYEFVLFLRRKLL